MQRWQGRVALVTGASSGIGAAVCRDLVQHGVKVVGLARRENRLQALSEEFKGSKGEFYYVKTDLTKENEIVAAFDKIKMDVGGVDLLINNAGIGLQTLVKDGEMDKWETMFRLNVFAVGTFSRKALEALKSMKERGVDDGHIINISSIAAHRVSPLMPFGVYCSTKAAVKFLTEALRREMVDAKSKIKVTHLSPGIIRTEFMEASGWEGPGYDKIPHIEPIEIAKAVRYILDTPVDTQGMIFELSGSKGKFHYLKVDVTKENEVIAAFDKINEEIGGVDILINNAGIAIPTFVKDGEMDKWETMFRLNVFAVGLCSREALKSMKDRGVDDGHIINVSSIAAHRVSPVIPAGVYCASKTAMMFLNEALRRELVNDKSKIKVTHLSPGYVRTELMAAGGWDGNYNMVPHMQPVEIANAVHYILNTPTDTQVNEVTVRAVGEGI